MPAGQDSLDHLAQNDTTNSYKSWSLRHTRHGQYNLDNGYDFCGLGRCNYEFDVNF